MSRRKGLRGHRRGCAQGLGCLPPQYRLRWEALMRIVQVSRVLTDLIAYAEEVLRAPQLQMRGPAAFPGLSAEVAHRHAQPAEDVRVTRAAVIMVTALDGFFADKDSSWLML